MLLHRYKEIFFKYMSMLIFLQFLPPQNLCYMNFHRKVHGKTAKQRLFCGLTHLKKAQYNLLLKF